jgi:adenylyl- and sulfurtransferase ThiI
MNIRKALEKALEINIRKTLKNEYTKSSGNNIRKALEINIRKALGNKYTKTLKNEYTKSP